MHDSSRHFWLAKWMHGFHGLPERPTCQPRLAKGFYGGPQWEYLHENYRVREKSKSSQSNDSNSSGVWVNAGGGSSASHSPALGTDTQGRPAHDAQKAQRLARNAAGQGHLECCRTRTFGRGRTLTCGRVEADKALQSRRSGASA